AAYRRPLEPRRAVGCDLKQDRLFERVRVEGSCRKAARRRPSLPPEMDGRLGDSGCVPRLAPRPLDRIPLTGTPAVPSFPSALVAQWIERRPPEPKVAGSKPAGRIVNAAARCSR